jgi:hypothetical protein
LTTTYVENIYTGIYRSKSTTPPAAAPIRHSHNFKALQNTIASVPTPSLQPAHYSDTFHEKPTMGLSKDKAAEDFQLWLKRQPPDGIVAYSDGSKLNRWSSTGYGFAVVAKS